MNVVLHGEGQDGMFALGETHPSLSFRVTSDFQLIWGLTATHSKYTYNGSSWRDYEGCESTQLNGVGWRRWSSSLAWAFRLLQPLWDQSYVEGAMCGVLLVCTGLCSLTHVFCQSQEQHWLCDFVVNVACASCNGHAEGLRLRDWVQKPCSLCPLRPGLLRWNLGWVASWCSTSQ